MPKVVEESWDLNNADTTAIPDSATYRSDGVASAWTDMWKYQVPTGAAHILKPAHHFSIYLDTSTGAAEASIGVARLKIEVRDQSEADRKAIFGPALYAACRDFDDATKMAKLDLQSDFAVEEKMWIVIMVYHTSVTEYPYCYFNLETIRVRSGI